MTMNNAPTSARSHKASITYLKRQFGDRFKENEPMDRHTWVRIGGPAEYFLEAKNVDELARVAAFAWTDHLPITILGGGSNVLVSDKGISGLVLINKAQNVTFTDAGSAVMVDVESGAGLISFARDCIARGYDGLTWAVGIPGSVGGAVINNAGAFGGEMSEVVQTVTLLEFDENNVAERRTHDAADMKYVYRNSVLKGRHDYVVLSTTLALTPGDTQDMETLAEGFTRRRRRNQPLQPSIGSVFKNPTGDKAGRLLEEAGMKGREVGCIRVSDKHANFIINAGGGSAQDYRALVREARQRVMEKFGIALELEIEMIGDWS